MIEIIEPEQDLGTRGDEEEPKASGEPQPSGSGDKADLLPLGFLMERITKSKKINERAAATIAECMLATADLMIVHWRNVQLAIDDREDRFAIAFKHVIDWKGDKDNIKTAMSFSLGDCKDSRERTLGHYDPDQHKLALD